MRGGFRGRGRDALPCSLIRNTKCSPGAAALTAAANSEVIGMGGNIAPVFCCFTLQMVPLRTCWRPTRTTSEPRKAVLSGNATASVNSPQGDVDCVLLLWSHATGLEARTACRAGGKRR